MRWSSKPDYTSSMHSCTCPTCDCYTEHLHAHTHTCWLCTRTHMHTACMHVHRCTLTHPANVHIIIDCMCTWFTFIPCSRVQWLLIYLYHTLTKVKDAVNKTSEEIASIVTKCKVYWVVFQTAHNQHHFQASWTWRGGSGRVDPPLPLDGRCFARSLLFANHCPDKASLYLEVPQARTPSCSGDHDTQMWTWDAHSCKGKHITAWL